MTLRRIFARREVGGRAALVAGAFVACYFAPLEALQERVRLSALPWLWEGLFLVRDYTREHVLLCLVPALLIAGAISTFIRHDSVIRHFGPDAPKAVAYGVASVSGAILAVCSCTVLPIFAGIYRMGAGLGPACAFLYAGPAINVLAIILTARVLGPGLGAARAAGAVAFSIVIGLAMQIAFRGGADERQQPAAVDATSPGRPVWQSASVLAAMVGVLVFANWGLSGRFTFGVACCPGPDALRVDAQQGVVASEDAEHLYLVKASGEREAVDRSLVRWQRPVEGTTYTAIHRSRFAIAGLCALALAVMLRAWFTRRELAEWGSSSWGLALQILPLLLAGVALAGILLGRPGREGLIPSRWVASAVGGNSLAANLFAAVAGALMYFATLTEVPIVQGLLGADMGEGPALALLLAGPALSLPSVLVIRSVLGARKTAVYVLLVVTMATLSGVLYGWVAR